MVKTRAKVGELRVWHEETHLAETFPVFEGLNYLGKDESCDIQLSDYWISQRHARFEIEQGEHFIEDLSSTNGTKIGNKDLRSHRFYQVNTGTFLYFGRTKAEYTAFTHDVENQAPCDNQADQCKGTPTVEIKRTINTSDGNSEDEIEKDHKIKKPRQNRSLASNSELLLPIEQPILENKSMDKRKTSLSNTNKIGDMNNNQLVKIAITGVQLQPLMEKSIKAMNWKVTESITECTHLVVGQVRRTFKLLSAIALKKPIVTVKWLETCISSENVVDESDYLVSDEIFETQMKFSFKTTVELAKQTPSLLHDKTIWVSPKAHSDVGMLKELIIQSGGTLHKQFQLSTMIAIVGQNEKKKQCQTANCIVSAEWLLMGILQQRLDDETYKLIL